MIATNPMTLSAAILSTLLFGTAAVSGDASVDLPLRDREKCVVPGAKELRAKFGASEHTAEQQELMELEWRACQMFGDSSTVDRAIDAIVADHGVVLLMDAGIAHGKEVQKEMFKQYFDAGYDIVWEPVHAETSGDIAWVIGLIAETKPDGSVNFGKYVSTWKKMNGKWMNTLEMRNSNGGVPLTN